MTGGMAVVGCVEKTCLVVGGDGNNDSCPVATDGAVDPVTDGDSKDSYLS